MVSLDRTDANTIRIPLAMLGCALALFYGRQLSSLIPNIREIPPVVTPQLYDWSTVQFGVALVVVAVALSNRSALNRIRIFRLSAKQRRWAFVCAAALVAPWATTILAGIALGYRPPFGVLWLAAFVLAFAGLAGLLVLLGWRVWTVYFRVTDRAPYVGVSVSRREAIRSGVLGLVGTGAVATTLAAGRLGPSKPEYLGESPIVYEREGLRVRAVEDPVHLGESITFEVTNVAREDTVLGCHNPWALQAYEDAGWHHVTWTASRYYQLCATVLGPGETTTATVPLAADAIVADERLASPELDLTPGTYRFVLLGTRPYLAVNFQVFPETGSGGGA